MSYGFGAFYFPLAFLPLGRSTLFEKLMNFLSYAIVSFRKGDEKMFMIWIVLAMGAISFWGKDQCWTGPDEVLCKNCGLGRKCEKEMSLTTKVLIGLALFFFAADVIMAIFHIGLYSPSIYLLSF